MAPFFPFVAIDWWTIIAVPQSRIPVLSTTTVQDGLRLTQGRSLMYKLRTETEQNQKAKPLKVRFHEDGTG